MFAQFLDIIFKSIKLDKNLPSIFLEEFREIRNYNLKLPWKKNPKKIYTSTSASNDDIFNISFFIKSSSSLKR